MKAEMRAMLEIAPKGKKVVAWAPDWPGLERWAPTRETAIEKMFSYVPRYMRVAEVAGLGAELAAATGVTVVEEYPGTGSTDFWGVSFGHSSFDKQEMSLEELDRELTLMQACWTFFDDVRSRVSAELQKGPRGGGRDREQIVRHTFAAEQEWSAKVGLKTELDAMMTDAGLRVHREEYCAALRAYHAEGKPARTWPLRYLIRHTAYHLLDHAWEMEDKDLTGKAV